jgi:hypothetical protein
MTLGARKAFINLSKKGRGVNGMKSIIILVLLFTLCITAYSQSSTTGESGRFQSVGGDYGKSWISDFKSQNEKPKEDLKNDLWDWGGAPKGKKAVGGKLVDDTDNLTPQINFTANWLGTLPTSTPLVLNATNPYGNYGRTAGSFNQAPLTPLALSDDPWVLAQQLDRPVAFKWSDYYAADAY